MVAIKTDIKKLSGSEKAAIVVLCLGEEKGSSLLQNLDEREILPISRSMAGLGMVSSSVVDDVLTEFMETMATGGGVLGNTQAAESYLGKFFDSDKVEEIMRDVRGPLKGRSMWERFSALNETVIAGYLRGENPQTVAAIMSKVAPDVVVKVMPLLPEAMMHDVIERMIKMEAIPRDMLEEIEHTLETEFVNAASRTSGSDQDQRLADVFNKLDPELFNTVSSRLEEKLPDAFARIKQKMFTFEDLGRLDLQSLGRVIRAGVEGNRVPTALKGADKELREYFLSSLPERTRNMLLDEMNTMGPVRMRDVQEAQSALVDVAKALAEEGTISLPSNDEDDVIIE